MANRANLKKGLKGPQKMRYQMGGDFMEPNKELTFGGIYQKGGPKKGRVDPDKKLSRLKKRNLRNFDTNTISLATPLPYVDPRNKSLTKQAASKMADERNEKMKKFLPTAEEIYRNSQKAGENMTGTQATLKALAGYGAESRATMGEATIQGSKKRRNKQQLGGVKLKEPAQTLKQKKRNPRKPSKMPKQNPQPIPTTIPKFRKITKL
jgi:hypothetical protein